MPTAHALDQADEIVISEGLAPSENRDLIVKIAEAIDTAALEASLRARTEEWNASAEYPKPTHPGAD